MIFLAAVILLGLIQRQPKRYWLHAAAAVIIQFVAGLLFAGGGTLEDPTGDGIITAMVRRAAQDGPGVLLMVPFALGLGWGVPLWLCVRGYTKKPAVA